MAIMNLGDHFQTDISVPGYCSSSSQYIFIAYPGSSAEVLGNTTLITLERAINGIQGMQYSIFDATSAGEGVIQIVF